jgi:phosphate transport system permease protein
MAVPTIFTLAEDALRKCRADSRKLRMRSGRTACKTIVRVLVPASLSGIISAVLLGLGRVIGETMVVLLCAGTGSPSRILRKAWRFFSAGPHHDGIIAQEMGEVVRGSVHYRALFMVGFVLLCSHSGSIMALRGW